MKQYSLGDSMSNQQLISFFVIRGLDKLQALTFRSEVMDATHKPLEQEQGFEVKVTINAFTLDDINLFLIRQKVSAALCSIEHQLPERTEGSKRFEISQEALQLQQQLSCKMAILVS
ncbi:hypothetical protein HR060_12395 [Catenovulum sp. SM1970]|uniref:hypothetical protein n=1 Tax=Marinifaba aquimaris TaxID=2741323 RepID=UPI0015731EA6|nr:hypothetical protein [Marinifaba aquimaris]NTS77660.1 hypothetical protein [Marinifaba aquimaris]